MVIEYTFVCNYKFCSRWRKHFPEKESYCKSYAVLSWKGNKISCSNIGMMNPASLHVLINWLIWLPCLMGIFPLEVSSFPFVILFFPTAMLQILFEYANPVRLICRWGICVLVRWWGLFYLPLRKLWWWIRRQVLLKSFWVYNFRSFNSTTL